MYRPNPDPAPVPYARLVPITRTGFWPQIKPEWLDYGIPTSKWHVKLARIDGPSGEEYPRKRFFENFSEIGNKPVVPAVIT